MSIAPLLHCITPAMNCSGCMVSSVPVRISRARNGDVATPIPDYWADGDLAIAIGGNGNDYPRPR